jgi:hypothetical protein
MFADFLLAIMCFSDGADKPEVKSKKRVTK